MLKKIELLVCDHRKIFKNDVPWLLTSKEEPVEANKVTEFSQDQTTFLRVCPQEPEIRRNKEPNLCVNPYPTAFPYGNGMVLHFYQQQESSTTKTVHKVINRGLKAYV